MLLGLLSSLACGTQADRAAWVGTGESWPAADMLFRRDPRWLGGDGAYSCDLGDERSAWLFGDSFIAHSDTSRRADSTLVRNSVAVQTGRDPTTAQMQFAWRQDQAGKPTAFFPDRDATWHWPGACLRDPGGSLFVFVMVLRSHSGGLGFESAGFRVAQIDNPDAPPAVWHVAWIEPPAAASTRTVGTALVVNADHVLLLAIEGDAHVGSLARVSRSELAAGSLAGLQWWLQDRWLSTEELHGSPSQILDDAGSEASLQRGPDTWLHIASRGFGASDIVLRTAPDPSGPWSAPTTIFTPPESLPDAPFPPFVYAGKSHPQLSGSLNELIVTYASNSLQFGDLFSPAGEALLYWPRFARIRLRPRESASTSRIRDGSAGGN